MATITSSSTLAQILAAYDDNLSYMTDGSTAKALAFIEACMALLRRMPASGTSPLGHSVSHDIGVLRDELAEARKWYAANSTSGAGGVKHYSFEDYR